MVVDEDLPEEEDEPEDDTVSPSAKEIVTASLLSGSLSDADVSVTMRPLDVEEEESVKTFADRGCKCTLGHNKSPCCHLFSVDHYLSIRSSFAELSHDELDMMVMGQIMATCFHSSDQSSSSAESSTSHNFQHFFHHGHRICQITFLFMHTIGIKRFKNIKASYLKHGPAARVHGNTGRKPKRHLTVDQIKDVIQFIQNYTG